jgi:hypothetical protein
MSARTPGREKRGGALMPVRTPERFGVGTPEREKAADARGRAICSSPGWLETGEESGRKAATASVRAASTGRLSERARLALGSPRPSASLRRRSPGLGFGATVELGRTSRPSVAWLELLQKWVRWISILSRLKKL